MGKVTGFLEIERQEMVGSRGNLLAPQEMWSGRAAISSRSPQGRGIGLRGIGHSISIVTPSPGSLREPTSPRRGEGKRLCGHWSVKAALHPGVR